MREIEKQKRTGTNQRNVIIFKWFVTSMHMFMLKWCMQLSSTLHTPRTPFEIRILCSVFVLVSVFFMLYFKYACKLNCVRLHELCAVHCCMQMTLMNCNHCKCRDHRPDKFVVVAVAVAQIAPHSYALSVISFSYESCARWCATRSAI